MRRLLLSSLVFGVMTLRCSPVYTETEKSLLEHTDNSAAQPVIITVSPLLQDGFSLAAAEYAEHFGLQLNYKLGECTLGDGPCLQAVEDYEWEDNGVPGLPKGVTEWSGRTFGNWMLIHIGQEGTHTVAHELFHWLSNSFEHNPDARGVMAERSSVMWMQWEAERLCAVQDCVFINL